MPSLKIHCALSKQRTGKSYAALHSFIDEVRGINHRVHRHAYTWQLKKQISQKFGGQEAVNEWLFHIIIDNLHTLKKAQGKPLDYRIIIENNGYTTFSQSGLV